VLIVFGFICLVFLALDRVEQKLILNIPSHGGYKIHRMINQISPKEIPIFGSSRALCHFAPSLLSSHCFNYGMDGTGVSVLLFFLKKEIEKKKEGPVIINIDPWGNRRDGAIGNPKSYILSYHDPDVQILLPTRPPIRQRIPGVRFYGFSENLCPNIESFLNRQEEGEWQKDSGATLIRRRCVSEDDYLFGQNALYSAFQIDPFLEKFISMLESLPSSRVVLIVVSPLAKSYYTSFQNQEEFNTFLSQLSSIKNVYVFNFLDDSLFYPREYWADWAHLNLAGVRFLTARLSEQIQAIPELKKWFPETADDLPR